VVDGEAKIVVNRQSENRFFAGIYQAFFIMNDGVKKRLRPFTTQYS